MVVFTVWATTGLSPLLQDSGRDKAFPVSLECRTIGSLIVVYGKCISMWNSCVCVCVCLLVRERRELFAF